MHSWRLIRSFARASAQNELAYRANFWISLLHALLNLATGVVGVMVVFDQVESVHGWDRNTTLALFGIYLIVDALRGLFIGPSLNALGGLDGEIWTGRFDYTLLRPAGAQFLASWRHWRPLALIDLALGLGVLGVAVAQMERSPAPFHLLAFVVALAAGVTVLYSLLLALTSLVFWSPFLFTWLFDALFQTARYPAGLYPGWLRPILTWVLPVGMITTVPAQALTARLSAGTLIGSVVLAAALFIGASVLFRIGQRRYASASS